jgi:hypothetical protein
LKKLRIFAALSVVLNTGRLILCGGVVTLFLVFGMSQEVYATENQEQVVVSPAQQAVNQALATATTEVQQAIAATDTATATIATAQVELTQAQSAVDTATAAIAPAQTNVSLVDTATATINAIDLSVTPVTQDSQVIQDAKTTVITAQTSINNIDTVTAQTQLTEATLSRTVAISAQTTAQTELTQANIAIDNAQTAVNNLQATIGNSTNVLAGVDDAGIRMNLPFGLLMGGTLYNNVFVGSNATITFGVDEGWVYYTTPNAPSVSIAGWDWTTWSTGTGITYATTANSLDIAWDVRPFPQTDASTQMVQIRFFADVNPTNGAWMADVSANGPIPNGARFNYRETAGGAITNITDTNSGAGFNGQINQGPAFTPTVDPNTAPVQAAVDAANATIAQLNASLTPVVAQNATNTSAISVLGSSINSLTTTLNSIGVTKTNLQSELTLNATELTTALIRIPEAVVVPEPQPSPQPQPAPIFVEVPDFQPSPVELPLEPVPDAPVEEEIAPTPEPEIVPEPMPEDAPEPVQEPELTDDDSQEPPTESITDVEDIISDALEDGVITSEEKEAIVEALLETVDGEALTAKAIVEAGLTYNDLPPTTPVEVRQDENGNQVIITAEVAAALVLLENPAELIGAIFDDPGQVLLALGSIGADMSEEEREEATKMVVATVVAAGAAINAATVAAGVTTSSTGGNSTGGGSSGGGGATGESKGVRRRKP